MKVLKLGGTFNEFTLLGGCHCICGGGVLASTTYEMGLDREDHCGCTCTNDVQNNMATATNLIMRRFRN